MKTIEERAEKARCIYFGYLPKDIGITYKDGYIQGATEQKAIDDAELAEIKRERDAYYDELLSKRQRITELEAKEKALKKWIEENSEPIYEEGVEPWNGIVKEKLLEFLDNYGKEE